MTSSSDLFDPAQFDPAQYCLELSSAVVSESWQQSRSGGNPASCWNRYLNQLCLQTVLPWLREERCPQATVWPNAAALSSFGELVNGVALGLNGKRVVLIPSEAIDTSELRVPQEWVDIPDWAADYYLGVKVNPDDWYIRLWGYCTHYQIKTTGQYDSRDRSYSIPEADLIADLAALWVVRQLNPQEPTRADLAALPALSLTQSENLIQRLSSPTILLPRLAIPFELWGALMAHGGWRQRLADNRQGLPEPRSIWQWLQEGVDRLAQQQGWERVNLQPRLATARGEASAPLTLLARQLVIADHPYELQILPLGSADSRIWRFELSSLSPGGMIPAGFKLKLLTEDLQPFEGNEDVASTDVAQLYVEVMLQPGEGLVWEIEPLPEQYDREILRF